MGPGPQSPHHALDYDKDSNPSPLKELLAILWTPKETSVGFWDARWETRDHWDLVLEISAIRQPNPSTSG